MMTPEDRKFVKDEIRKQMNIVLFGASANASESQEDVANLFPGMPTIEKRPVMHPFGFVSRALAGTVSVVARVGEHIGNRLVLGHRDSKRPTDIVDGECALYNQFGQRVYLKKGKILVGSASAAEPMVLGNVTLAALTEILAELKTFANAIKSGPIAITSTPGNPAPTHPTVIAAMTSLISQIDAAKSTYISDAGSNIVSKESFTQRGGT